MKRNGKHRVLSVLLAALLVLGMVSIPGSSLTTEAKTKKKTTTTETSSTSYSVAVPAALITGNNVTITVSADAAPATDDGVYHIYAQDCYESGAAGTEVAQLPAVAGTQTVDIALNLDTANSMLYKKFVVCSPVSGVMTQLSNAEYITNPEAASTAVAANRYDGGGKKGMLIDGALATETSYPQDLGIDQITYNMNLGTLLTDSSQGWYTYEYNGKTYQFAKAVVDQFALWIVPTYNKLGISVTLILLNNLPASGYTQLIHPQSQDGTVANYYAFNTADASGAELIEAIGSFLGSKFNGTSDWGTIDNFIIGNEVNARAEWSYINEAVGEDYAAQAYLNAVRLFYNGIKSHNANANVYVGIDHEWSRSDGIPESLHYGAASFLTTMNTEAKAEGNFNYGIAVHPYNAPLYNSWTLNPGIVKADLAQYITDDQSTVYITMANIDVLTDFLCQSDYLQTDGQVRSVLCSELGYTSMTRGAYVQDESTQAAAVTFATWQAMNNQYIDGIFMREVDHADEINGLAADDGLPQCLATGLLDVNHQPKAAYNAYKYIDDPNQQAAYLAQAAAAFGVEDLSAYIHAR